MSSIRHMNRIWIRSTDCFAYYMDSWALADWSVIGEGQILCRGRYFDIDIDNSEMLPIFRQAKTEISTSESVRY